MDKNNLIGVTLIFLLFFGWAQYNAPSEAEMEEMRRQQDSIAMEQVKLDSLAELPTKVDPIVESGIIATETDSMKLVKLGGRYGVFAPSVTGNEKLETYENDLVKVTLTNKGGRIKEVLLKDYNKVEVDKEGNETKIPLYLMEDEKNKFEYYLPMAGVPNGSISTADLFFKPVWKGNTLVFQASTSDGGYFEQSYTFKDSSYNIDYNVKLEGLANNMPRNTEEIELNWVNYLDKLERNYSYERNFSSLYFMPVSDDEPDYCSCTGDDTTEEDQALKWVSHSNQFFNSTLMAADNFNTGVLDIKMMDEGKSDLKRTSARLKVPVNGNRPIAMNFYIGPNEFDRLAVYENGIQEIIPYGRSIFGTVNRWIIRPIFNFLSQYIGSVGIVILLLTFLLKTILYPLQYKMLYSQSKMAALKPRIEALKAKLGDDQQAVQMETMKLYREYGANPLGGCLPMVIQIPIWFALYRFFPASIEFRQAPFLWATDLSSYDVFAYLPFEIPFYGTHISMFTLLWAITTVIYTYYNTKHMDMSANPAMKYMQYMMPIMFLFFFNSFASALSCYLFFNNIINIGQTVVTKNFIIDQDKLEKELQAYKKKPKKKGGFQEKLAKALEEQKKLQEQREKGTKGGKKKR